MPTWSTHEIELLISEIEERQVCGFNQNIEDFILIAKKVSGPVFASAEFMQLVIRF